MFITILSNRGDQFSASIQVQSSRPIYNSSYSSPVLNYNDKDFVFDIRIRKLNLLVQMLSNLIWYQLFHFIVT
jgi:hypothetical protein